MTESGTTQNLATHLDAAALEQLRSLLEAERAEILSEVTDTDSIETDLADDPGTRLSEREELEAINALQLTQLGQVDEALARMEAGTFGTCQECGTEIPFERLEAMPSTRYCVQCQARQAG